MSAVRKCPEAREIPQAREMSGKSAVKLPGSVRRLLTAGTVGLAFIAGACVAQDPFPNIRSAQDALASATMYLEHAPPEFGGHKARAMQYIRAAQDELMAALAYRE